MNAVILLSVLLFISGTIAGIWLFPKILDYVLEKSKGRGVQIGPWRTHLGVGQPHIPKVEKAAIARVGLGANSADETIYWNAFTDSEGRELNSSYRYKINIPEPIAVKYEEMGFCSFTVYGENKFLVENKFRKYMIRFTEKEIYTTPFPCSIYLGKENECREMNFIPLPDRKEKFSIALRCYRPADIMKKEDGVKQLKFPEIIRENE